MLMDPVIDGETPCFRFAEGRYYPGRPAIGPWRPDTLGGSAVCGALAHAIERHAEPELVPARFTAELLSPVSTAAFEVGIRLVHDGRRVRAIDAAIVQEGETRARATCLMVRHGDQPDGARWSPMDWDVPSPESIAPEPGMPRDIRLIEGTLRGDTRRRAWLHERRPLVAGAPLSAFQRIAQVADFASPFSNSGTEGLSFINSDVSLALHRLPIGEWIGVEVSDHQSSEGISVGSCRVYDRSGSVGMITTVALSRRQRLGLDARPPAGEVS